MELFTSVKTGRRHGLGGANKKTGQLRKSPYLPCSTVITISDSHQSSLVIIVLSSSENLAICLANVVEPPLQLEVLPPGQPQLLLGHLWRRLNNDQPAQLPTHQQHSSHLQPSLAALDCLVRWLLLRRRSTTGCL